MLRDLITSCFIYVFPRLKRHLGDYMGHFSEFFFFQCSFWCSSMFILRYNK